MPRNMLDDWLPKPARTNRPTLTPPKADSPGTPNYGNRPAWAGIPAQQRTMDWPGMRDIVAAVTPPVAPVVPPSAPAAVPPAAPVISAPAAVAGSRPAWAGIPAQDRTATWGNAPFDLMALLARLRGPNTAQANPQATTRGKRRAY